MVGLVRSSQGSKGPPVLWTLCRTTVSSEAENEQARTVSAGLASEGLGRERVLSSASERSSAKGVESKEDNDC